MKKSLIIIIAIIFCILITVVANKIVKRHNNNDEKSVEVLFQLGVEDVKDSDTYSAVLNRPFIIYNGERYYKAGTNITVDKSKEILGHKVATSKYINNKIGNLNYNVEDKSIYSINGYDESFRVLMYVEINNNKVAMIFENFIDKNIDKGEEVFSKIKIKNNIENIKWDTLNNWIYKTENKKDINSDDLKEKLVIGLYNSEAYSLEDKEFRKNFFYNIKEPLNLIRKQKFLYVSLKDGTEVELRVFENGYIFYKGLVNYIFKVDKESFDYIWNSMV